MTTAILGVGATLMSAHGSRIDVVVRQTRVYGIMEIVVRAASRAQWTGGVSGFSISHGFSGTTRKSYPFYALPRVSCCDDTRLWTLGCV
jgi:hypothetical protein